MEGVWRLLHFANAGREFHPQHTFFNGQCFNWFQFDSTFASVFQSHLLEIKPDPQGLLYRLTPDTDQFEPCLRSYFQLDVSISDLYTTWAAIDPSLKPAIDAKSGMRILRQDPWECTISFLCSQNNNIKRITSLLDSLRSHFGVLITHKHGKNWYSFPTLAALKQATLTELRSIGLGYRAEYVQKICLEIEEKGGEMWLKNLRGASNISLNLQKLTGIGPKVADCIALFALDEKSRVPIDVHMWRVAKTMFHRELRGFTNVNKENYGVVNGLFREKYGEYAGWAHSLLYSMEISSPVSKRKRTESAVGKRLKQK